jgi:NitT/TauT family transport system substrate-binding protein
MRESSKFSRAWLKLVFAIVCLGAAALVVVGCGGDDDEGDSGGETAATTDTGGAPEEFVLTFPFQDSIIWNGYEIGRGSDGTFETMAGLAPETQAVEGNSQSIQQLISGKVDYAIVGAPEIYIANARGNEVTGIANLYDDVFTVVSTDESGTTSVADLEGKSIGVTDLGGGEIPLVNAVLADAGLTPGEDVELKVVGPGGATAFKALESGEVAAFGGAINDLVPLESQGLRFNVILPDDFQHLPSDFLAATPAALEDPATVEKLQAFMKAWNTATVYGAENPEDGLARICELVPEDCQDPEFARGFYDAAIGIAIDEAHDGGCMNYPALTVVRDAVASVTVPEAADLAPEDVFSNDYCEAMIPTDEDVAAFVERTGATK